MSYEQNRPNAVQVEFTEGCNLRCDFCGLQGIREQGQKNLKFMDESTIERLASEMARLKWNSRVEFAMHGEPTLHPNVPAMIATVRRHLPKNSIMLTSNGGGLLGGDGPAAKTKAMFDAGLNVLAIDDYKYVKIGEKVRFGLKHGGIKIHDYPKDPSASPHERRPADTRMVIFIKDISQSDKGNHSRLNNHAGAAFPPLPEPAEKRCAKPFRELSVRWDGNIAICCNDWRGVYKVANISMRPLDQIWNGPEFNSARRALYHGMRGALSPCNGCDDVSYRVGLLPDPLGAETLPKPSAKDKAVMKACTAGKSYTLPVLREWEVTSGKACKT